VTVARQVNNKEKRAGAIRPFSLRAARRRIAVQAGEKTREALKKALDVTN
jgi:hypothetical protein